MKHLHRVILAALLGLFLLVGAWLSLPSQAAPPAESGPLSVKIWTEAITQDHTLYTEPWTSRGSEGPQTADFIISDTGSTVNTHTWFLDISADGTVWANHPTSYTLKSDVVTTNTAYAIGPVEVMGQFYRLSVTASLTNTAFTPTIWVSQHP